MCPATSPSRCGSRVVIPASSNYPCSLPSHVAISLSFFLSSSSAITFRVYSTTTIASHLPPPPPTHQPLADKVGNHRLSLLSQLLPPLTLPPAGRVSCCDASPAILDTTAIASDIESHYRIRTTSSHTLSHIHSPPPHPSPFLITDHGDLSQSPDVRRPIPANQAKLSQPSIHPASQQVPFGSGQLYRCRGESHCQVQAAERENHDVDRGMQLNKYPMLRDLETRTKVPKAYGVICLGVS